MSTSLEQLKSTAQTLSTSEQLELAQYLLGSAEAHRESSGWFSFFGGVGSVLEVFPTTERFAPWRMTQDVSIDEWPSVVRGLLAELQQSEPSDGEAS
jgi:hypothetical protein